MLEDDLVRICQWAVEARINAALLDMVFVGAVAAKVEDGELVFTSLEHITGQKISPDSGLGLSTPGEVRAHA